MSLSPLPIQGASSTVMFPDLSTSLRHPSSALTQNQSNLKEKDERWKEKKMMKGNSKRKYWQALLHIRNFWTQEDEETEPPDIQTLAMSYRRCYVT
jgi:hypothetical protein